MKASFADIATIVLGLLVSALLAMPAFGQDSPWAEAREIDDLLDDSAIAEARALVISLDALFGDDPAVLWARGNLAFHEGRYAEALVALDGAVAGTRNEQVRALRDLVASTAEVVDGFERYTTSLGHFEILHHPSDAVLLPWADRTLEGMYHELGYDLGFWPEPPIRVEFYPRAQYLAQTSSLRLEAIETSGTIALCKYNKLMITSPRGTARGYGWLDTMSHEYVHYAVSHMTQRSLPIWLHEALAKYLEARWSGSRTMTLEPSREDLLGERIAEGTLITFEQMHPSMAYLPSPEDASVAYAQVFTIMEYLVQRRGSAAIRDLLERLRDGAELEAAFEGTLGEEFAIFESSWMSWLSNRPRIELPGTFDDEEVELRAESGGDTATNEIDGIEVVEARDLLRIGELLRARGQLEASVVQYRRAEQLLGNANPVLQNAMARALVDLNRPEEVLIALSDVRRWYPDYYLSHLYYGAALNKLERFDEALLSLDRAVGINPFDPRVHEHFAIAYDGLERSDEATQARQSMQMVSR